MRSSLIALLAGLVLVGCGSDTPTNDQGTSSASPALKAEIGLTPADSTAEVVADGLMNPSGVSFDASGRLTVCDSGHGRVLIREDGAMKEWLTGFDTEFWKVAPAGETSRFKLGPLSAVWLPDGKLVVSDGGKKDGQDRIMLFANSAPAAADSGKASEGITSTTDADNDAGEGNPCGMAVAADGKSVWVCGQGSDLKTWILRFDPATMAFTTWASSDDEGIPVNSPMQVVVWDDAHILVLYSGTGGTEDGLIVKWNTTTKKAVQRWKLPGLIDPMGMARVPGSDDLMVVDNNWALTEVQDGKLARVSLTEGEAATVSVLATGLRGPTSCAFGPDGALYIAELGPHYDKTEGRVIAVRGLGK